ncbi:MAG: hypothetical protein MJ195_02760 [Mycoplasmoidaceae bacterium]|nr:hypothetical protein [Mycoplasmoidaceae bacterium]
MTQNCKFDYGHLPEYKTIAESAAQNFNALGDIDGTSINHASPAYMLPDKFSKTDPENC